MTDTFAPSPRRRRVLQWGGAGALAGTALPRARAQATAGREPPRLALLIGNRDYPDGDDLPPIHKNVRDLRAALEKRGFDVSEALDVDVPRGQAALAAFATRVRAAPPDATVFFYFSGHGAQVDAENLLVGANQSPKARPETLLRASLTLTKDVVALLPRRPQGLTIAVVDACRTSLREVARGDGLNQVEAPPGCLIAFATGAGKPAIAPADDKRNTFYTASLVKLLAAAPDEVTFSELFRLVRYDVKNVMENHPVLLLRQFAQDPFIAENTQVRRRVAPEAADEQPVQRFATRDEAADFAQLEAAVWPAEVQRLADDFLKNHPKSRLAASAQVAQAGAREAATALKPVNVKLYRSAFAEAPAADAAADLAKAGRGDKDAAARMGRRYGRSAPQFVNGRYEGWLQYATQLGNGIASYELALHYRRTGQPLLAQQFEARARELGYTPPPSLDNSRK